MIPKEFERARERERERKKGRKKKGGGALHKQLNLL